MRHFSHFNTAKQIISLYRGEQPFGYFIKDYFRQQKKFGSKDRKRISQLCYCYFRLGNIWKDKTTEDRILLGVFLTLNAPDELLHDLKPEWNQAISWNVAQKMELINGTECWREIFPFIEDISEVINSRDFAISHLQQPDLFLRIRPGKREKVKAKLQQQSIDFQETGETALSLPNSSKLETVLDINREVVVQDLSSQRVSVLIKQAIEQSGSSETNLKVWDCCAASGGKSIMTFDIAPAINLTVSDIRQNIIINLKKRFAEAGINKYRDYIMDLGKDNLGSGILANEKFDLIIADVPCTGSGTWGRTPEQLSFFPKTAIAEYAAKQRKIVKNVIPFIQQNGFLLYITCSVYRKENEENIEFISEFPGMKLKRVELFEGYHQKADTLFAALFQRSL